jgi:DNA-binding transcriptional regulator GbsR (MarR family)
VSWFKSNLLAILGICAGAIAFGYTTLNQLNVIKSVVERHDAQFKEVNATFEKFNNTLKDNYSDWAKTQKVEVERAEKNRKEDLDKADKQSEKLNAAFLAFTATSVKVDTIGKTLDGVVQKIDAIQSSQQTNQHLLQQNRK